MQNAFLADKALATARWLMFDYLKAPAFYLLKCHQGRTDTWLLNLKKQWNLDASYQQHTLIGAHRGNNFSNWDTCVQHANDHCRHVNAGAHQGFVEALRHFVSANPAKALWENHIFLGEDTQNYQHVHACADCHGAGEVRCRPCHGSGTERCWRCYGTCTVSCFSCGGSGRNYANNNTYTCSACAGSGKTRCLDCHGSGHTTCTRCHGRGNVNCQPCHATGYFTERLTISVQGSASLHVIYPSEITAWGRQYIDDAINDRLGWLALSKGCTAALHLREFTANHYPVAFNVPAGLTLTTASIGYDTQESECWFVGSECHPYYLANLGDDAFFPMLNDLASASLAHAQPLQSVLESPAARALIEQQKQTGNVRAAWPCRVGLISQAAGSRFFDTYCSVLVMLKKMRSTHGVAHWLAGSLRYMLILLCFFVGLDAVTANTIPWESMGLKVLVSDYPQFDDYALKSLRWLVSPLFTHASYQHQLVYLGVWVGLYTAAWWFLMDRRRFRKRRILFGLTLTYLVIISFLFCFERPIAWLTFSSALPSIGMVASAFVNSLLILPEIVLSAMFVAMLRLRQRGDKRVKKIVTAVQNPLFVSDMEYGIEPPRSGP